MIDKLKEILNKDKKTSNLILIVVLLIVLLIASNYIFDDSSDATETVTVSNSNVNSVYETDLENKLATIISKINGVKAADVMISYSTTEKVIPVYDIKENIDSTKENIKESTKTTTEKTVAYESKDGSKVAIVESKETATATGAIVVVSGFITNVTKNDIRNAVSYATNIPIHKIQIFVNE
ncbi:MAG: hypothetical protein IKL68_04875 [Clostridia bacterium]|nr:hypothetical protein [Clostridia bacterium]